MNSDSGASPSYWQETRQPIYSAALILPFIVIYECGLLFLHADVINGGDAILLSLGGHILKFIGIKTSFVSVLVLILFFLIWQVWKKGTWKFRPPLLLATVFESVLYAVLLFLLLGFIVHYLPPASVPVMSQGGSSGNSVLRDFVLYCGAGVYEELVFRVLLLGLLMLVLMRLFHMERTYAAVWSVILGAIIFSAFHHIGGERFALGIFLQRVIAGLYFSAIYLNRSFGLAAASHSLYDLLVGLNQLN